MHDGDGDGDGAVEGVEWWVKRWVDVACFHLSTALRRYNMHEQLILHLPLQ